MTALKDISALLFDPHAGMRASVHNMLNLCGITRIDHAVSAGSAIRPLRNKAFDLIICEYDLGEGQDGQQLLEDLRHNKLIPLWTMFVIVTAERAYEKIVSAAELTPTDYLLKPFTADALMERITRAVEKRAAFLPVYYLMEEGALQQAIAACEAGESQRRYALDFMRLRAELHVTLGEAAVAEGIYRQLAETKSIAWARLGLAKTLFMQQRYQEAEELLSALVAENSRFMDAHDWLAKTHEAIGQLAAAKEVLANAVSISPHAVRRLRKLGEVALETGDVEVAERSFQRVVAKAKYSEFRDPEDHVRLVQALVRKGEAQQAAGVIRDMERSLAGVAKMPACRALSAALLHTHKGDAERAATELQAAVSACRESTGLSNQMKMALAKSCLENSLDDGAAEVMMEVMSNTAEESALAKAMSVFEQAGRKELAERVVRDSRRQVVELVAGGAEKAKQGDYKGAVELMAAAVGKLPDNPQVVFNAAVAGLKCLENEGWDGRLGDQVRGYIETARRLDPANPRLSSLAELYQGLTKKYGIRPAGRA